MNVGCYKPLKRRKYILFRVYVSSYLLLVRLINCKTQLVVSGKKYTLETKYASSPRRGGNQSIYNLQVGFFFFFLGGEISSSLDWLFKESFSLGWKLIWCGQDSWSPFTPYRFVLLLSPLWVLFQDWCSFVTPIDLTTWTLFYFGCGSTQLLVGPIPRLMQLLLSLLLTLQHDSCWHCFIITMAGQIWRGNGDCYKPPKPNTILFGNPQSIIFGLIIVLTQALLSHVVRQNQWSV